MEEKAVTGSEGWTVTKLLGRTGRSEREEVEQRVGQRGLWFGHVESELLSIQRLMLMQASKGEQGFK